MAGLSLANPQMFVLAALLLRMLARAATAM